MFHFRGSFLSVADPTIWIQRVYCILGTSPGCSNPVGPSHSHESNSCVSKNFIWPIKEFLSVNGSKVAYLSSNLTSSNENRSYLKHVLIATVLDREEGGSSASEQHVFSARPSEKWTSHLGQAASVDQDWKHRTLRSKGSRLREGESRQQPHN